MERQRNTIQLYRRLLGYVRPYRWRLAAGLLCGVLYGPTNALVLQVVKRVWAEVFERPEPLPWNQMLVVALLLPAVTGLRGALDWLQTYCMNWVGLRVVIDMRQRLFEKVLSLSLDFFGERKTGDLMSRVSNDVGIVQSSVTTVVEDLVKQPVMFLSVTGWLVWSNPKLSLVVLVVVPFCVIPLWLFGRQTRKASRKGQELMGALTSVLHEGLTGWRVIKVFCAEQRELKDFGELCRQVFRQRMKVIRAKAATPLVMEGMSAVAGALVFLCAYKLGLKSSELISYSLGVFMLYEPIKKISKVHLQIAESLSGAERVFELLDQRPSVVERATARELPRLHARIEFENVHFEYEPGRPVLQGVSFAVPAGAVVALVGASGAGKTTLLNLVPRFLDPQVGVVRIDGQDIREVTFASLRGQIGLVSQETFLFNDTVAANIAYGKPGAHRAEIIAAAQRAHAHEFIQRLPQQYDTLVGEVGMKLSGGQRQRLAIARAILKNPPILLLDEATSALDTESERLVQAALDNLMWGDQQHRPTMLVIAHRLSTVQHADQIIVLDKGRVVEQGSHEELLASNGVYRRLHDLQFPS